MDSTMKYKKIFTVIFVVVIAVMINVEDNSDDVTFADKKARLPSSKIKTFRFISQLSTLRYWTPSLISCEPVDNSPIGIGKHYTQIYQVPLYGNVAVSCMVMGYESPQYISYICNDWLNTRVEMSVEESSLVPSHPTLLKMKLYSRRRSIFFKYLISPALSVYYDAWLGQSLFSLKYALEQFQG